MKKCTVIINPTSGKGLNDELRDKINSVLENYNYEANVIITEYRGHAEKIIEQLACDLVISVGGDGTFHEVMNGNLKREKPIVLGHIPVGTTNDIGYMYGLGKNIISNLRLILDGEIKEVDMCNINDRDFVYVASFGQFMEIPYETPQQLKHRIGYLAYLISGVKTLFKKRSQFNVTYEIDGVKHNGDYTFIIISNANRIAGINNFYNEMKLDDDKFEVMFCSINKLSKMAKAFYTLKTSDISCISGVEIYKTNNLKIIFNDDIKPWCLDGEKFDCSSKEYNVCIKHKVKMLVPKSNIEKLFIKK